MAFRQQKKLILLFLVTGALAAITVGALVRFDILQVTERKQERFFQALAGLTLRDPLFWDWSLDPKRFESAVAQVLAAERSLAESMASNKDMAGNEVPKDAVLFLPRSFLKILPAVGQASAALRANPSRRNAKRLLAQYRAAIDAYEYEVNRLANASNQYLASVPAEQNEIAVNISLLRKNVLALREEINRRKICLETGSCEIRFPSLAAQEAPQSFPRRLPDALLFPSADDFVRRGMVRIPSGCWDFQPTWHEVILGEKLIPSTGKRALSTKLADENLYVTVVNEAAINEVVAMGWTTQKTAELNNAFARAGIPFMLADEGRFTRCTDLSHYPKALTLLWLKDKLAASSGLGDLDLPEEEASLPEIKPVLASLQQAETEIQTADVPSWDQAVHLAASLRSLLELNNRGRLPLADSTVARVAEIHAAIVSGLPGFDEVLRTLAQELNPRLRNEWRDFGIPSPEARIPRTTFFVLSYLTFSKSAWRIDDEPLFFNKGVTHFPRSVPAAASREALRATRFGRLVWYSQIKHLFSQNELIDIGRKSYDFAKK